MSLVSTVLTIRRRLLTVVEKLSGLAPLLIRVAVGLVFIRTGWGKLTNLAGVTEYFTELGIPMPGLNAAVAASTEFFGGILFIAGLGTRLVALPLAFTMVVAMLTAKREDIEGALSILRFEELHYLVMFIVVALIGAGPISLDALIARRLDGGKEAPATRPVLHPGAAPSPQS